MAGIDAGEGAAAAAGRPEMSPRVRVEQKLVLCGVPEERLQQHQGGLLLYLEEHKEKIPEIVAAILSVGTDLSEAQKASKKDGDSSSSSSDAYGESLSWLQWLMFDNEPDTVLGDLEHGSAGKRAVCGAVWGHNDLAYRCRTCENDPTCAICVPCFQNGNHKDHDYSIMYTGGGCCDCGDATAWKHEGFCSRHKGAEQIKPLPEELASSVGPVLDALLLFWKERICLVEGLEGPPCAKADGRISCKKVAEELTTSVANMLLGFCTCSESLLSFVSQRIRECPDLLDALTRAERLLDKKVVKKLHELLLKLISEPAFKYEFAKVFIHYCPVTFGELIKGCNDSLLEEYPLMPTFSVQIFTVPTLTPRLVREVNLLGVLLGCLTDLFQSCIGEDGRLQTTKWENLYDASIRLLEDTRYVLSHEEVSKYVAYERPDLTRSWIKLLSLVQGMDPQKRVTSIHAEDESENLSAPFVLGHYLGIVQNLLMKGAFSPHGHEESADVTVCSTVIKGMESAENQRHAKVGRVSQENSKCILGSRESSSDSALLSPAAWLILQCLKAIESWLEPGMTLRSKLSSLDASSSDARNFVALLEDTLTSNKYSCRSNSNRDSTNMEACSVTRIVSLGSIHLPNLCSLVFRALPKLPCLVHSLLHKFQKDGHVHPPLIETTVATAPELPQDILMLVFATLEIPDLIRAGSVCCSWHSAYTSLRNIGKYKQSQTPCLLYTCESAGESVACLYSLVEKRVYVLTLPEPPIRGRLLIGSSLGWLVTADERSEMHLLNPLTGEQIALPSVVTIEHVRPIYNACGAVHNYEYSRHTARKVHNPSLILALDVLRDYLYFKAFVFADTSTGRYMVALIHHPYCQLSFARVGDDKWTWLPPHTFYKDCTYKDGLLYAVTSMGQVHAFDLSGPVVTTKIIIGMPRDIDYESMYIVQAPWGDLLNVWRSATPGDFHYPDDDPATAVMNTTEFKIHVVDAATKKLVKTNCLRDHVLFLGCNQSLCLSAEEYPPLKANHVYFTDDIELWMQHYKNNCRDIGVLDMRNNSTEELVSPQLWSNWPAPIWITPSFRTMKLGGME